MILLSTEIYGNNIAEVVLHYNRITGVAKAGDQMTRVYTCVRRTKRWPFRLVMEIIAEHTDLREIGKLLK